MRRTISASVAASWTWPAGGRLRHSRGGRLALPGRPCSGSGLRSWAGSIRASSPVPSCEGDLAARRRASGNRVRTLTRRVCSGESRRAEECSISRSVIDLKIERVRPSESCTTTKREPLPDRLDTSGSVSPKSACRRAQTVTSDTTRSRSGASCATRGRRRGHRAAGPPAPPRRGRPDRRLQLPPAPARRAYARARPIQGYAGPAVGRSTAAATGATAKEQLSRRGRLTSTACWSPPALPLGAAADIAAAH